MQSPSQLVPTGENTPVGETITTAIHIPKHVWSLLRAVAFRRAQDRGGRASVSKLLTELVEGNRAQLEKELELDKNQ